MPLIRKTKWPEIFPDKLNKQFLATTIGIGGVSNSGKSKLAGLLKSNLSNKEVAIICQDDYIHPQYEIPQINDHIDWESSESINFVAFKNAILEAVEINDVVIADGFLAFYDPRINELYDRKIFLEISKEEFCKRKRKDTRWGEEPEWYIEHIWKTYQEIGQVKFQKKEYLIVDGSSKFDPLHILSFLEIE